MRRGFVLLLTPALLLGASNVALAQGAAAVVQQIHDEAYAKCMSSGAMGLGSEQQANCSCAADVAIQLLSDEAKEAIAGGTMASYKGPLLKGDELARDVALVKTCPKLAEHLHTQYCSQDAGNPHCQILERAQQQAQ